MTLVRTKFKPGEVVDVEDAELLDLTRQGLIVSKESDEDWQGDDEQVESTESAPPASTEDEGKADPAKPKPADKKGASA